MKNGKVKMQDQRIQQRYLCGACGKRSNERTNTRWRDCGHPQWLLLRQSMYGRKGWAFWQQGVHERKSHSTIIRWEQSMAQRKLRRWSPVALEGSDMTVEGD